MNVARTIFGRLPRQSRGERARVGYGDLWLRWVEKLPCHSKDPHVLLRAIEPLMVGSQSPKGNRASHRTADPLLQLESVPIVQA